MVRPRQNKKVQNQSEIIKRLNAQKSKKPLDMVSSFQKQSHN